VDYTSGHNPPLIEIAARRAPRFPTTSAISNSGQPEIPKRKTKKVYE